MKKFIHLPDKTHIQLIWPHYFFALAPVLIISCSLFFPLLGGGATFDHKSKSRVAKGEAGAVDTRAPLRSPVHPSRFSFGNKRFAFVKESPLP
jgi:hypothetical protein